MPKIYTRSGDDGSTGLIGGKRVTKDSPRIEACGSLDELNAGIGVARSQIVPDSVDGVLRRVQEILFVIGAELAHPEASGRGDPVLGDDEIRNLENEIDKFEESLKPIRQFILPGGSRAGAQLHLVRALVRRTERKCVALSRNEELNSRILGYLNRLSDLCFVLARYVNQQESAPEEHPIPGNNETD